MAFEAKVSLWRTGLLIAGALGFVTAGLWLVGGLGEPRPADPVIIAIGWIGILFFALCAIAWSTQLLRPGVVMRVDANGIYWRRWSQQTIPWKAISRVESLAAGRQRQLCLFLKRPGDFPGAGVLGKLAAANKAMGYGDIALNLNGTDRSFDELLEAVDRFGSLRRR